jgi:hypothetical protein
MTPPLTDAELAELDGLECRATDSPWEAIRQQDPRGQPSPIYRGLVALFAYSAGPGTIAITQRDGLDVSADSWMINAELMAAARNALRSLLDEIKASRAKIIELEGMLTKNEGRVKAIVDERLLAKIASLTTLLKDVEFTTGCEGCLFGEYESEFCSWCARHKDDGHNQDCKYVAALAEAKEEPKP